MGESGGLHEEDAFAARYLELLDQGRTPDLDSMLSEVPEALHAACRLRVREAESLRGLLDDLGLEDDGRPAPLPDIPGFRIEGILGEGALSIVYSAFDLALERRVALKVLRGGTSPVSRARLLGEARKAAGLSHPSIVTIHSVAEHGPHAAIVMERIHGYPIDEAARPLTFRQKARMMERVAHALSYAHGRGIIHRDLKPDNVLVTSDLRPHVLDFGLAVSTAADQAPGGFVGTPLYASPEQAAGARAVPASDVFSLGSLFFAVLTGRPPYEADSVAELLERIRGEDPPFPRAIDPQIPQALQAICLSCLARDPANRPTAGDVASDLARYLAGEPPRVRPAFYSELLDRRVAAHERDLETWEEQGIISIDERDEVTSVYRRILADEDPWVFDARRLSFPQIAIYVATWSAVVAATFPAWIYRDDFSPAERWALPAGVLVALLLLGVRALRRREILAAAAFLSGAVLSSFPALSAAIAEWGILPPPDPEVEQLFGGGSITNASLLAGAAWAFLLSALCFRLLRLTAFAWTTVLLAASMWFAWLLTRNWLDRDSEVQALLLLPLVLAVLPAIHWERGGRIRWALPAYLLSLAALVLALDLMAADGGTWKVLGVRDRLGRGLGEYGAFAANGIVLVVLTILLERSRSLDLRRGARFLALIVPPHLLTGLYLAADRSRTLPVVLFYFGAVLLLFALAPWRCRRTFLTGGLGGVLFGALLLVETDLVEPVALFRVMAIAGLIAGFLTYRYLVRHGSAAPAGGWRDAPWIRRLRWWR